MSDPEEPALDEFSRMEALVNRLEIATTRAEVLVSHLAWLHEHRPALPPVEPEEPRTLSQVIADNTLQIVLGFAAAAIAIVVVFALFYGQASL